MGVLVSSSCLLIYFEREGDLEYLVFLHTRNTGASGTAFHQPANVRPVGAIIGGGGALSCGCCRMVAPQVVPTHNRAVRC
jgi:hypothetical protein